MAAPDEVLNIAPQDGDKLRSNALTADVNELPEGYYRSPRLIATFLSIALNLVATYFAFKASAAAVSSIIEDVGASKNASLFSTVWSTGQAICILLMGRLTDRFGRRPFFMVTNAFGFIGGIVACTAKSMETLIGAQVLLGVSWGGQRDSASNSSNILGILISGAVTLIVFALYECLANLERPIIPMKFFRDLRGFTCLVIISSTMGVMNLALFIMYPQQVIYIFGSSLTVVFSLFTGFVVGFAEDVTMLVVQYIVDDEDLGVAFGWSREKVA
ncbi:hypothetical protein DL764_000234 [Monosporascus ibericus]|uniref:Major facilitator superfamily (MFS) profile domain-containing protein n=1 Tax=Monosporascus ibericus TaxID=155417 RepID=A0A4Q4TZR8_9PEZI|nr:hypothetical protein DL764_000234 [Monosporascus ibericus]